MFSFKDIIMSDTLSRYDYWNHLKKTDVNELIHEFDEILPVEISDYLSTIEIEEAKQIFLLLTLEQQSQVFIELDFPLQHFIYINITQKSFADIFSFMPSESRVIFYKQLSLDEQIKLLPFLKKRIREDVIALSAYSEDTAGGIMSTDFATIYQNMTVAQAMQKIKKDAPSKKMIYYIYVVDVDMKMLGFVSLKDLILADENGYIINYLHDNFVYSFVSEDREIVSNKIEKYSLIAVPILNDDFQLVGIVRYDDAIGVIIQEQNEDMEKLMGIVSHDNIDYIHTTSYQHYKDRIGWLIGLFCFGTFTSIVMSKYEGILSQIPQLSLFLPMISATGGNTGCQAASVIIRALSLNEIQISDCIKVILKEMQISIMIAMTLFFFAFTEVFFINYLNNNPLTNNLYLPAMTISIALCVQVLCSIFIGTMLPILVKCFKMDPAIVATPAITIIVDVVGIVIYLSISAFILL